MANLCPACFGNSILRRRVEELRRGRSAAKCSYHPRRSGLPASEVAELIDAALRANYTLGESFGEFSTGDDLLDVLRDVTNADDHRVLDDLVSELIDGEEVDVRGGDFPFYDQDQTYVKLRPEGWEQSRLWEEFRLTITHDRRFFNEPARALLTEIFDKVQFQKDRDGQPAFYPLDSGTMLYRARRVSDHEQARGFVGKEGLELGPPPEKLRAAGRMNAAGIGAFYGALDQATCIAELRPAVGSLVCIGVFRPCRPIHVLDLTRFVRPGREVDIFAKNYLSSTTQWAFMRSFAVEISQPILPGDEHLAYVPAQAVAEYLTNKPVPWRSGEQMIEGLVFRSAQHKGGRNLVLFNDAGLVRTEEEVPTALGAASVLHPAGVPSLPARRQRRPALTYVPDSLKVIRITSADYDCKDQFLVENEEPGP